MKMILKIFSAAIISIVATLLTFIFLFSGLFHEKPYKKDEEN